MSCTRIKYMHHENIKKLRKNVQGLSLSETFGVFIFYFWHYIWLDIRIEICEREVCLFCFFVCFSFVFVFFFGGGGFPLILGSFLINGRLELHLIKRDSVNSKM